MPLGHPILQFGTSRFLQAHVDLFVSQALDAGQALGGITVVQTTGSAQGAARVAALAEGRAYPVRLQGLMHGREVDELCHCHAVKAALSTTTQWHRVRRELAEGAVQVVVSNTGDAGWQLADADGPGLAAPDAAAPQAFPAKLLVLLHDRWQAQPEAALSLLPCELVSRNGDRLRELVAGLARAWQLPAAFEDWLRGHLVWGNSLVDRIVSAPLEPAGAIAEPYALWAIERTAGLIVPCRHPAIVPTDALDRFERLKLWLLNLAHTVLAELWLREGQPAGRTVLEAMHVAAWRLTLEGVWTDEVLPVFDALGQGGAARAYRDEVRERLLNPFLAHRLADIAGNHDQKKARRLAPVVAAAREHAPALAQPWLCGALASSGSTNQDPS
ncbi:mannitol dehydrogenase family protein [Ideonella azotifigens]|uniref:Mannitol dehydrogenase family protein n=1 Tax=Ideonella azotifigens TaxID=513160 RepID=A0ABP3VA82_9BURK|nr:mannitol dehydrogenase family protein [Ideonella azotifigens]MCD2341432.1 mannitol dehydrogenase family protein [Ideonella azotifigens]